jgi:hypothetical protein
MNIVITEQQYKLILEQRSDAAMDAQAKAIRNLPSEYKHTLMTILGIGSAFIPFVGPFIAMGIGIADAKMYYDEGDKKTAALVGILSAIPAIGGLAIKLGLSQWTAKALGELGKKISLGSKLLPEEISAAKKIAENKNLILSEINKIKSSFKTKPSFANSGGSKGLVTPLMSQLSTKIQNFIELLPISVKVGPKLSNIFKGNYSNIKSLSSRLSKYKNNGSIDLYSRKLSDAISVGEGKTVNLKELYTNASFLKKELETIKSLTPKPKQGGKAMENWYNAFYSELSDLNKLTSELETILKSSGTISQKIGL